MTDLVTIGETMALLSAPKVGRLRDMHDLGLSAAGSESNVAIGVRRLGYRSSWIGRVGGDELGGLVLSKLRSEDVDVERAVVDQEAQTALMFKERRSGNVVKVVYYRRGYAGSRLSKTDVDPELIESARALHVTGITLGLSTSAREAVKHAVEIARAAGVLVSFDLNYRAALWTRAEAAVEFGAIAKGCDVVFAGEEELAVLGSHGAAEMARRLVESGARAVVVKRGSKGAFSLTETGVHERTGPAVTVVDPVGAGDAFVAGYLAATFDGLDPGGRLALGCAAGAYAVTIAGDWEGMPSRGDIELLAVAEGTTLR
ncbi:MAG TPA: sugar kinase [Acidimicrobiales bacterium]|nr:sugar kinase [Acidimicrobiales bacterium]